jgi:hypothetical protein
MLHRPTILGEKKKEFQIHCILSIFLGRKANLNCSSDDPPAMRRTLGSRANFLHPMRVVSKCGNLNPPELSINAPIHLTLAPVLTGLTDMTLP